MLEHGGCMYICHESISGGAEGHQVHQFVTCSLVMQHLSCYICSGSRYACVCYDASKLFQVNKHFGPALGACACAAGRRVL